MTEFCKLLVSMVRGCDLANEASTGISYEAWNLILFVVLQPLLIVLFFAMWVHARFVR